MRIYLDNAATSWPKPESVYEAVDNYQRELGAAHGRGAYRESTEAHRIVQSARQGCARLLGVDDPRRIVFGGNGTDALNLALHGLLRRGDHVVTTACEHNSVLRPLAAARDRLDVDTTIVRCDSEGFVDPADIAAACRPNTRLAAVTHASNVTGAIQPIAEIAAEVGRCGALLLVDAAQTAGHMPIDAQALNADLLAASGHKGMLGPLGVGLLYVRPGIEEQLQPVRQGGTGVDSRSDSQPATLPERYEAGNLNLPGLAGLAAATKFLADRGVEEIRDEESKLTERLVNDLSDIDGCRVYGPSAVDRRSSVVSFAVEGYDPQELAAMLDASHRIQCRAGLHCAPLMHEALGTDQLGGLVRLSVGWSTTDEQVDSTLHAVRSITSFE